MMDSNHSIHYRPLAMVSGLLLCTFAYFFQAGGWNQNSRFALVRAIGSEHTFVIDSFHSATGDKSCRGPQGKCKRARKPGEHYYSDKAPGTAFVALPAYWAYSAISGAPKTEAEVDNAAYVTTIVASALPGALGACFVLLILLRLGYRREHAIAGSLVFGAATLVFPYSTLYYGHVLEASSLIAGLYFLLAVVQSRGKARRRYALAAGATLGLAGLTAYQSAFAIVVLLTLAYVKTRDLKALLWVIVGAIPFAMAFLWYHYSAFGGPLTLGYEFSTDNPRHQGIWGVRLPNALVLVKLLFSEYRGLFWICPWLMAFPVGYYALSKKDHKALANSCLAIFVFYLLMNSGMPDWYLGWSCGPRALIGALPFVSILAIAGWSWLWPKHTAWKVTAVVLVTWSGFTMTSATAVSPEVSDRIHAPYTDVIIPKMFRGDLAQNRQSFAKPSQGKHFRAWNWGTLLGIPRPFSLLPLYVLWLSAGSFLWLRYRKQRLGQTSS